MRRATSIMGGLLAAVALTAGCSSADLATGPEGEAQDSELRDLLNQPMITAFQNPPVGLAQVNSPAGVHEFWPYTGENFSGAPQDPVNLVFLGEADPRSIRAALLALDGDRSALGLPNEPPFNSTWDDAIGDVQTAYGANMGWTGNAIQLECGGYGPLRFHLRVFRMHGYTVGNAHFELLIPGTTDHQVLSWEMAEQFVLGDMMRSGLLDPGAPMWPTGLINEPNFRTIPATIYNLLPVELRAAIGGPLSDVTDDVPIGSDGVGMVVNLAGAVPWTAETRVQDFVIQFDQVIPKPFCALGPLDYVAATGDVHLYQSTTLDETGRFTRVFRAEGELSVVPVNPITGEITGPPLKAQVKEQHNTRIEDDSENAQSWALRRIWPGNNLHAGIYFKRLQAGSGNNDSYNEFARCPGQIAAGISDP